MLLHCLIDLYQAVFRRVSEARLQQCDLDSVSIHTHLACTFATAPLMWGYTVLAFLTISSPVPWIVGFAASTIHLLSIFLFRYTSNILAIASVMLVAGVTHQGCFAFYTGGFTSNILIWFGVIPMLGGLIAGRRGLVRMGVMVTSVAFSFLIVQLTGYEFPMLITPIGFLVGQGLMVFGWIGISVSTIYVFIRLRDRANEEATKSNLKTHTLLKVLMHDIVSPIMVVNSNVYVMKKMELSPEQKASCIENIDKATSLTMEVIRSIKAIYAVQSDSQQLALVAHKVSQAIEYAEFVLAESIKAKELQLIYDPKQMQQTCVMVDPVVFNNQIFLNIVSNAVKFSRYKGKIFIEVAKSECPEHVNICIRDEGIGMPAHVLDKLFDIGSINTRIGTDGEKGSGYGLVISKSFIEKIGGSIRVQSVENQGTEFVLTLRA